MESELLNETLQLLADTDLPVAKIADDLGVSRRWLYELKSGDFVDPGVRKIETLNRYLREQGEASAA